MTRDEAIKRTLDSAWPTSKSAPADIQAIEEAESFVDALGALGVLKLDGLAPRTATAADLDKRAASVDATGAPRNSAGAYIGGKWVEDAAIRARCEPPPEHRGKRWHWLQTRRTLESGGLEIGRWEGNRWSINCDLDEYSPAELAQLCWRYVAPCEEPKP